MEKINGLFLPRSFRGYTITDLDFSKIKNCSFVVLEISEDMDTPNDQIALIVQLVHNAGLPCFALWSFDPVDVHADISNGGDKAWQQLSKLIFSKTFHGLFVRITNTVSAGSDFPSINMALMIQEILDKFRTQAPNIYPYKLNGDNIMLMADVNTIKKYTEDENVPTQLARELLLAPCDIYRNANNIIELNDMATLDTMYDSLELIGLDGEPHSRQDSLYAQRAFGHLWAEDAFLINAGSLSNGGKAVAGAMRFYGTLGELESFTGMDLSNVDDPEPPAEPPTPPAPPEEDPPADNLKLAIQNSIGNMATIVGDIADLLPDA